MLNTAPSPWCPYRAAALLLGFVWLPQKVGRPHVDSSFQVTSEGPAARCLFTPLTTWPEASAIRPGWLYLIHGSISKIRVGKALKCLGFFECFSYQLKDDFYQ